MNEVFVNVYADDRRAMAYAQLEFPGTYYLAFRDLPRIFETHVQGRRALDFGCGAGRSTRFLRDCGFEACGVDISAEMIRHACERDPHGDYRLVAPGELAGFDGRGFDLVTALFTFDNIPMPDKLPLMAELRRLLAPAGCMVLVVSSPELYINEWASFSTSFAGNRVARTGDVVRTVMKDVEDSRPVDDIFCPDAAYCELFAASGLALEAVYRPLGKADEPYAWINETRIAPWVIYVLRGLAKNL